LYDNHSLSNETRSLAGSVITLMVCKVESSAMNTLAGILELENCFGQFCKTTFQLDRAQSNENEY